MYLAMKTRLMMLALAVLTSATLFSCKKDDKEGDSNIILEKTAVTLNLGGQTTVKVTAPDGILKPESEDVDVAIANMGRDINVIISSKKVGGKVGETRVKIESKTGGVAYINVTVKDEMKTDRGIAVLGKTVFVNRGVEVEVTNLLKKYNGTIDKVNIKSTSTALAQVRKDGNRFFVTGIGEGLTGEVYFEDTAGEKNDKGEFPQGSFIVHVRAPFLAVQSGEVGVGQTKRIDLANIYNNAFTFEGVNNDIATVEYAKELDGVGKELSNGNFTGIKVTGKKEGTFTFKLTNSDGDNGKGREISLTINVIAVDNSAYIIKDGVLTGIKAGVNLKGAIKLPDNVTKVAATVFKNQPELTEIDFNNVTEIEGKIFSANEDDVLGINVNLTSITLPKVVKIGDSSFRNAKKLTRVELPATLTHLGQYAFSNCTALQHVAFRGTVPPKGLGALPKTIVKGKREPAPEKPTATDAFDAGQIQLYIPLASKSAYKDALGESPFRAGGIYNPRDISEFR
ncbi:leucine-rich repeat domain-containing protein [Capnocytophaga ochracea]|nr:leucine-rich repeat domain-containing protein [Capnocytophaga ochracea]